MPEEVTPTAAGAENRSGAEERSAAQRQGPSRRAVLAGGGLAAVAGAAAGFAGGRLTYTPPVPTSEELAAGYHGDLTVPWSGTNQAGILTAPQGFAHFIAFDLQDGVDRTRLGRLMRIWTDDISRLAEGRPGLTDSEPELAEHPARLTFTVGFGPGMFEKAGMEADKPAWLRQLPPFPIDQLEDAWSGGDLFMQICAEDPSTVTHAARYVSKEAKDFATVRWVQHGYRNAAGQIQDGRTFRNQFGQLDGTSNLQGEEPEYVWIDDPAAPAWLQGGSTCVVRRIHMDLDKWDELDRPGREIAIGRTMSDGAPLTGGEEFTPVNLDAKNALGFPAIDAAAHTRRTRTDDPTQRFLRRPYNYDMPSVGIPNDHGLIFTTYQKDLEHQYIPVQERAAELDLLNQWTTPIGSAVFAIPRGIGPGEYLAQDLFE